MSVKTLQIDLPSDIFLSLNESEKEVTQRLKLALAIQLYAQEKVTLGKAAQIAGLSRLSFETLLAEHHITISSLTEEDILEDIEKLK